MQKEITAILVAYNSADVIGGALESLLAGGVACDILVVDNCSTDDTCERIKRDFPMVTLIENPRNEGFGRANNIGLARVKTPYALLINPDAVLQGSALKALLAAAKTYPDAAIVAPALYNAAGILHHSFKRDVFAREKKGGPFIAPEGDCCADFISGAMWLLNMSAMRSVGFFDPGIFLYYEDDDVCLRVRRAGLGLVYVPAAKAVHLMGSSTGAYKSEADYAKQQHMIWSRLYLEHKYHGGRAALRLSRRLSWQFALKAAYYRLRMDKVKFNHYQGRLAGIFQFSESAEIMRR